MSDKDQPRTASNFRTKIILLAIIFLLPLGYAVYLKMTEWRPAKTTNYGELVVPAIPLKDVQMQSADGKAASLKDFSHHWLMVTFGSGNCDAACEQNIYKMRQVHIAQGKYQMRVKRLLILSGHTGPGSLAKFKEYPGMVVVTGPNDAIQALGSQFRTPEGSALDGRNRIYLVDPLGNLMMSYDADAQAGGIRKDLGRLLRVSRIG
jgi:hypothetical protein